MTEERLVEPSIIEQVRQDAFRKETARSVILSGALIGDWDIEGSLRSLEPAGFPLVELHDYTGNMARHTAIMLDKVGIRPMQFAVTLKEQGNPSWLEAFKERK